MEWHEVFVLFTAQVWISTAAEMLYILPDNSTNVICPSQPCATLSQYWSDNGTLPVVSNVEYHFLPGEHYVPANMMLRNLQNFSIIGIVNETSSLPALIGCSQSSYIINIIDSHSVTIANVMFKQCHQVQLMYLLINLCHSCTIENVTFMNSGLIGTNLIGASHLSEILIRLNRERPNVVMFCQGITLNYGNLQSVMDQKHTLIMNKIKIIGDGKKCYSSGSVGLHIGIEVMEYLTITLNNSLFYKLSHTALSIISKCNDNNKIIYVDNCTFEQNAPTYNSQDFQVTIRPLIDIVLSHREKSILFKQCSFKQNYHLHLLISFFIRGLKSCHGQLGQCSNPLTNISFITCQFDKNIVSQLLNINSEHCKTNLLLMGPSYFTNNKCGLNTYPDYFIFSITDMAVNITGPIIVSSNKAKAVIVFKQCDVSFYGNITFKSNLCTTLLFLKSVYFKIMQYANLTFRNNRYRGQFIATENYFQYNLYPYCLFQFVTMKNITASPTHYSVNVIDNFYSLHKLSKRMQNQMCLFPFYHFTRHCKWIPTAVFYDQNPKIIYQQIITTNNQNFTYHKICHCIQNGSNNCSVDTLGPVYPGQILQVDLCTPCNDEPSTLYAEVNSMHLPDTACKVGPQTETMKTISNYSKMFSFTIVSDATDVCELILIADSSYTESISEAFYVQLLTCPLGFTLQHGVCDCDPILSPYIDKCYIDYSAISRPASTWITAHTQANITKYLISDCPMDYCLPYSSLVNFLHPDLQCQFNRTGILCSQCQHPLSMVFASSRCMECTNLHILMTIIIIVAGIVLVVLLYLLNLTVTKGTINGIIFYANIISINDSVFLVNDNVFKPLGVFISFVNLDLGIETCFYSGMDSYAKIWLQLVFPCYLFIIAISIVIASRYSSKILRLTYTRSLPVLATLFLLSYTGVLRTVLTVLFSYSTITHLPGSHRQMVWSIDASVPLFGIKFTILFITCLVVFLLLIPFNITLLFTRYLLQFRVINRFKPLLDAFQGSYKDKYYFWVVVHIIMRSLFFAMYAFQTRIKLVLSTVFLITFSISSGYIRPHKNKLVNVHELLLLINLTIMYAVSYQSSNNFFSNVTNVMISLAFIQLFTVMLYHFLTYTCHYNVEIALQSLKEKLLSLCCRNHLKDIFDAELLNIPECTYNYTEYQDGLVSDDFK